MGRAVLTSCSRGRSSVRPKMHQTGTYNIDDLIGNVPNSQGRVVGTGSLENCCWNRLITTFLPILVCNCPLESPEMQKPGRSATWSRCWTVRIGRRDRDLSIKACWALPVIRRLGHSLAWSNQLIPTQLWAICDANQLEIVSISVFFSILMAHTQSFSDILNLFSQKYKTRKISICTQTLVK